MKGGCVVAEIPVFKISSFLPLSFIYNSLEIILIFIKMEQHILQQTFCIL